MCIRDRRDLAPHHFNDADGLSLPLEIETSVVDESLAVDVELRAGQMSFHDVFLVHGSEPNHSPNPRRGMTLRFMPTTSIYRRDLVDEGNGSIEDLRTLYLMRGRDVSGRNDFRVRW